MINFRLVYIRKSQIKEVLCSVKEDDIPNELTDRLQEEKKIELVKRREKNEAHLYMTLRILLEDAFCGHQVYFYMINDPTCVSFSNKTLLQVISVMILIFFREMTYMTLRK